MPPLPTPEERSLRATGARRTAPGTPPTADLVRKLRELGRNSETLVALFDAGAVAGERHLLSAWAHLGRSRGRGETRLRERGAEFALYVAGEDQLPRALARVGVSDTTEQFVVVAERPLDPAELVGRFGLVPDPTAYPGRSTPTPSAGSASPRSSARRCPRRPGRGSSWSELPSST